MSSSPFVPFYTSDFLGGTSGMTASTKGVYITLLCLMYEAEGPLTQGLDILARRSGCTLPALKKAIRVIEQLGLITVDGGRIRSATIPEWNARHRKEAKRPWVPLAIQRHVFERDGEKCAYCGATEGPFHLDHIFPWSLGGEHTADNLTVACAQCNWSKGGKTLAEWRGF